MPGTLDKYATSAELCVPRGPKYVVLPPRWMSSSMSKDCREGRQMGGTSELVLVHRAAVRRPCATLDDEQQHVKGLRGEHMHG